MVTIQIHRSYTVTPSDPTPTSTLPLSHCDQTKLPNHGSQLYIFTTTNSSPSVVLETLRSSLSKALVHYYPLAGRLRWIQDSTGRFELLCNSHGVQLVDATCHDEVSLDIGDLGGDLLERLVPKVDYGLTPIEDMPLLLAQLTRFHCGGTTLGVSLCRAVVDGSSIGSFMSSWARHARGGDQSLDREMLPILDRTVLDSLGSTNVTPRFRHDEFSPPPISEGGSGKNLVATAMLKLSKGQVEKLKRRAADSGSSISARALIRPYSSFEVISGYLWKCVCKVRRCEEGSGPQRTRLTTLVNCRNKLRPPLPVAYFGNATFPTATRTCCFDDIASKPLGFAVGNVREAIERMSDEYVRSAIGYIASQKDLNLLRENLYGSRGGGGKFGGNPNLYVVSWTNFPFYEADFGWGKPACLVPGSINSDGKAFLMNDGSGGDGFVVAVCLQSPHVDALKKLFYKDIEEVLLPTTSKL